MLRIEPNAQQTILPCGKAQIDIVPEQRRIGFGIEAQILDLRAMPVPFGNDQLGTGRGAGEGVAELAQTAADTGHEAAVAKFSAGDIALCLGRPADLTPEAEGVSGGNCQAVERCGCYSQILDFAQFENAFALILDGVQRAAVLSEDICEARSVVTTAELVGWRPI